MAIRVLLSEAVSTATGRAVVFVSVARTSFTPERERLAVCAFTT
jgi:hypothetical protein